jgi:hypothetical protein
MSLNVRKKEWNVKEKKERELKLLEERAWTCKESRPCKGAKWRRYCNCCSLLMKRLPCSQKAVSETLLLDKCWPICSKCEMQNTLD